MRDNYYTVSVNYKSVWGRHWERHDTPSAATTKKPLPPPLLLLLLSSVHLKRVTSTYTTYEGKGGREMNINIIQRQRRIEIEREREKSLAVKQKHGGEGKIKKISQQQRRSNMQQQQQKQQKISNWKPMYRQLDPSHWLTLSLSLSLSEQAAQKIRSLRQGLLLTWTTRTTKYLKKIRTKMGRENQNLSFLSFHFSLDGPCTGSSGADYSI